MTLFGRYGFRKTSIEEIARESGIAKGTVYLSFSTKEEIFRAACESLTRQVLQQTEAVAGETGRPIAERLRRMLEAKYLTFFERVHRSPHAAELLDSRNRLSSDLFAEFDRRYVAIVAAAIGAAIRRGELRARDRSLSAAAVADLLACAARGIEVESAGAASAEAFVPRMQRLVRLVVAALGGDTGSRR